MKNQKKKSDGYCKYTNISIKQFVNLWKFRNKKIWLKNKQGNMKSKDFLIEN